MTPLEQRLADATGLLKRASEFCSVSLHTEIHKFLATLDQPTDKWANAPEWAKWLAMDLYLWDTVPLFTHPASDARDALVATDAMVEKALHARVPGGAEVRNWLPMLDDAKTSAPIAYVIMNVAIEAALAAAPPASDDDEYDAALSASTDGARHD